MITTMAPIRYRIEYIHTSFICHQCRHRAIEICKKVTQLCPPWQIMAFARRWRRLPHRVSPLRKPLSGL
jgi:hypothetical protein